MYVTVVWASANGYRPTPVNSTQHRQVPNAPSFRIRSSNHLKRVDTPPAVPPNLRILPIPERALKQGWVIAREWPAAVSGSGTALGAKLLRSRRGQQTARFGNRGLPAMGWHYWGTTRSARRGPALPEHKKAPAKAGAFAETGAGNRNRTYDLRITNAPLYQLSYSGEAGNFTVALPLRSIRS